MVQEERYSMDNHQPIENKTGIFIGTGIVAGFLASLCCIGPLVLTVLGVSGAAVLSKFEFLRIPLTIVIIILFGFAAFNLYRKKNVCEPGSICADPKKYKKMVIAYWIGLAVALLGLASPYLIAWIF
jgi:mercuric ion transport protein